MKVTCLILAGVTSLALATGALSQEAAAPAVEDAGTTIHYEADSTHATIGFSVKHLVISKVRGHFADFEASLELDENNALMSASATIQVDSIDTANEKRDGHLQSADFFDAETYPEITFVGKSIEQRDGKSVIVGDFTIRDVTKEIALPYEIQGPVTDPWGNTKIALQAAATVNRTEYGLTWNAALETGGVVVGEDVEITIDVEFAKK